MERERDAELTRLSQGIDAAKEQRKAARDEVRERRRELDAIRGEIMAIDQAISAMRAEASQEFEYASLCYDSDDHAGAKEHSVKARALQAKAKAEAATKQPIYERLDQAKARYGEALAAQDRAHAALDAAHAAFHERIEFLKEQNSREWKQKDCAICGTPFRYNVNWNRIPNLCEDCRKRERAMWQERPCRRCGEPIRFRIDWAHPPNYCKKCKAELADQRAAANIGGASGGDGVVVPAVTSADGAGDAVDVANAVAAPDDVAVSGAGAEVVGAAMEAVDAGAGEAAGAVPEAASAEGTVD